VPIAIPVYLEVRRTHVLAGALQWPGWCRSAKDEEAALLWSPRYAVRRTAWHPLDHAWEIEDRSA
jgi:hypothetical protein